MDEATWLAGAEPARMVEFLRGRASERQLRLFACACCRRVWRLLEDRSRRAVEVSERFACGQAGEEERIRAWEAARGASDDSGNALGRFLTRHPNEDALYLPGYHAAAASHLAAEAAVFAIFESPPLPRSQYGLAAIVGFVAPSASAAAQAVSHAAALAEGALFAEQCAQCDLLRDITGNPFRPRPAVDPAWLAWKDGTIPHLARAIYDHWRFEDLPVLADALEEAGCTDEAILAHCRSPAAHTLGCWCIDLVRSVD